MDALGARMATLVAECSHGDIVATSKRPVDAPACHPASLAGALAFNRA